jgi:F-type H+-transporting ATPase subunit b
LLMIYQKEMEINIMAIDATFWVAISFIIFFGALIYLKIPQKVIELLDKMISDIKNEIDESEKLRIEAKTLLDNAQNKLDSAQSVSNEILQEAKKDSDKLIIELNDKFHKSSEIKKNLAENKISQMKEAAIKEIKDASIKIAVESVKKIITTSVDKSKLDAVFQKNLNETKEELKKINS